MKIDRLIGILAVLLSKDKVTAPYLAEKFEVSKRTIHRDIEAICRARDPPGHDPGEKWWNLDYGRIPCGPYSFNLIGYAGNFGRA